MYAGSINYYLVDTFWSFTSWILVRGIIRILVRATGYVLGVLICGPQRATSHNSHPYYSRSANICHHSNKNAQPWESTKSPPRTSELGHAETHHCNKIDCERRQVAKPVETQSSVAYPFPNSSNTRNRRNGQSARKRANVIQIDRPLPTSQIWRPRRDFLTFW